MTITFDIPDEIAANLGGGPKRELSRTALEALAIELYRTRKLSQFEVGKVLGFSRLETEDFLAQHVDLYDYEPAELRRELDAMSNIRSTSH